MNWKRFFALLLVLALLPALFGNAFAAGPKARTLTDADYAPIDALWAELDAVEQDAQTQSAQDGPDRALVTAQAVAEAVTASDLYVDGTLQWRGAQFSFETTTGVTCAYSPRLRELARRAAGSSVGQRQSSRRHPRRRARISRSSSRITVWTPASRSSIRTR